MSDELIRLESVSKFYGRVQALDDVHLTINDNEIVGLLGDNGAGKSTLIKIISGVVPLSSGQLYWHGKPVSITNTNDAIALGVETIYQDSALVNQLSIARNLFLGREPLKGPRILNRMDKQLMEEVAARLLGRSASARTSRQRRPSARSRVVNARPWPSLVPCTSTASSSSWTNRPTTWAWPRHRAC